MSQVKVQGIATGTDTAAIEAERQVIRDKYAAVQAAINAAQTTDAIKSALE